MFTPTPALHQRCLKSVVTTLPDLLKSVQFYIRKRSVGCIEIDTRPISVPVVGGIWFYVTTLSKRTTSTIQDRTRGNLVACQGVRNGGILAENSCFARFWPSSLVSSECSILINFTMRLLRIRSFADIFQRYGLTGKIISQNSGSTVLSLRNRTEHRCGACDSSQHTS